MKILWMGVFGILFASCFPFTNPLDPLSSEYIGSPSVDLDGDGIGSYRDVDDFHLIAPEKDVVIVEDQVTLQCSMIDPSYNSLYRFQVSKNRDNWTSNFVVYESGDQASPTYEIEGLLQYTGENLYWRAQGRVDTEWSDWTEARAVRIRKALTGSFTYLPILRVVGNFPADSSPIWRGALQGQAGIYSIQPALPNGISLDENTGGVSLDSAINELSDVTYTVSITGTGMYFGTITGTLRIAIHKEYKIGDTGLAGGFIFHVKTVYSDGWRYLESAPADQSTGIAWGAVSIPIGETSTDIGSGSENTQKIISGSSSGSYAAHLCANLDLGGFQDWFLPSKEELNSLYTYLYTKSLGNFAPATYWSSSETDSDKAWHQRFADSGFPYQANKNQLHRVRAIRAF